MTATETLQHVHHALAAAARTFQEALNEGEGMPAIQDAPVAANQAVLDVVRALTAAQVSVSDAMRQQNADAPEPRRYTAQERAEAQAAARQWVREQQAARQFADGGMSGQEV